MKVEAAARKFVIELDANGNAFTHLAQAGEYAGQVIKKELDKATAAVVRLIDELVKVEQARNLTVKSVLGSSDDVLDASGKVVGKAGSTVFGGKKVDVPEGYVFDEAAFLRGQSVSLPGGRAPDPANYFKEPSGSSGSLVKRGTATGSGVSDDVAARLKDIADTLAAKFGGAGSSHTVTIKTPSGASQTIGVASQGDGVALRWHPEPTRAGGALRRLQRLHEGHRMRNRAATTQPEPGFIRTSVQGAPAAVNMARALMLHAMAVLDEVESLTEAEVRPGLRCLHAADHEGVRAARARRLARAGSNGSADACKPSFGSARGEGPGMRP